MNDLIEKLSDLRSQFNCFDENERDAYHTLSEAIKVLSERPETCEDAVSRNAIIQKLNTMDRYVSEELILCDTDKKFPKNEVFIVDDVYEKIVENLPSAQPGPCEDAGEKTCRTCHLWEDGEINIACPWGSNYEHYEDDYCSLWEKQN